MIDCLQLDTTDSNARSTSRASTSSAAYLTTSENQTNYRLRLESTHNAIVSACKRMRLCTNLKAASCLARRSMATLIFLNVGMLMAMTPINR
jgi:hypothetical protein